MKRIFVASALALFAGCANQPESRYPDTPPVCWETGVCRYMR